MLRTLSRMVKDAARAEAPFLRVSDACYGYLLKYNMPTSRGKQDTAIASQLAAKRDISSAPPSKGSLESKPAGRARDRSHPRSSPSPRKKRGGQKSRHFRSPRRRPHTASAASLADKGAHDERMKAWLAGEDSKGSLRDKCKNCYIGLGTHAP